MVGCGLINFETLRFLLSVYPMIETLHLFDLSVERAEQFKKKTHELKDNLKVQIHSKFATMLPVAPIIAFGTTAVKPHIYSMEGHLPHAVILHTALRDLAPSIILHADNVADDIEQVCSNNTSVHLAEQEFGHRDFIRTTIGDICNGDAKPYHEAKNLHIFNPFGLGILDLAVAQVIEERAHEKQVGMQFDDFLPNVWTER